jgi:hypothetical protein
VTNYLFLALADARRGTGGLLAQVAPRVERGDPPEFLVELFLAVGWDGRGHDLEDAV